MTRSLGEEMTTQLDLFLHAPRHYHLAIERLSALDLRGCEVALAEHRRLFPFGSDPGPVEEAARWLAEHLPGEDAEIPLYGRQALEACRVLVGGCAPAAFSRVGPETARRAAGSLASRCLRKMAAAEVEPSTPLTGDLPWAVFHLWAGDPWAARRGLETFVRGREESPLAYLALGDALWQAGRPEESLRAYREGYGLDPDGEGWVPASPRMAEIRGPLAAEPFFAGEWWAVGAYLDARFPSYRGATPEVVGKRWERFLRFLGEMPESGAAPHPRRGQPPLFFAGLVLSENARWVGLRDLEFVRKTLRELNPQAYEIHLERLDEE